MTTCVHKLYGPRNEQKQLFIYPTKHIVHPAKRKRTCYCDRKKNMTAMHRPVIHRNQPETNQDIQANLSKPLTVNLNLNVKSATIDDDKDLTVDVAGCSCPTKTQEVKTLDQIEKSLENLANHIFELKQYNQTANPTYSYKQTSYNCYNFRHPENEDQNTRLPVNSMGWANQGTYRRPQIGSYSECDSSMDISSFEQPISRCVGCNPSSKCFQNKFKLQQLAKSPFVEKNSVNKGYKYAADCNNAPDKLIFGNVVYKKTDDNYPLEHVNDNNQQKSNMANMRNSADYKPNPRLLTTKDSEILKEIYDPYLGLVSPLNHGSVNSVKRSENMFHLESNILPPKPNTYFDLKRNVLPSLYRTDHSNSFSTNIIPKSFYDLPPPPPIQIEPKQEDGTQMISILPPCVPLTCTTSLLGSPACLPMMTTEHTTHHGVFGDNYRQKTGSVDLFHGRSVSENKSNSPTVASIGNDQLEKFSRKLKQLERDLEDSYALIPKQNLPEQLHSAVRDDGDILTQKRESVAHILKTKVKEFIKQKAA